MIADQETTSQYQLRRTHALPSDAECRSLAAGNPRAWNHWHVWAADDGACRYHHELKAPVARRAGQLRARERAHREIARQGW